MSNSTLRDLLAGGGMTKTAQGGLAFTASQETQARRFLTIGTTGGSYYVSERELTRQMALPVAQLAAQAPELLLAMIREVSLGGLAPSNDYALYALALLTDPNTNQSEAARAAAYAALPEIARTGTHLLHYAAYSRSLRGGGPGLNKALGRWFSARPLRDIAYQAIKYRQRDGWSLRDVLRRARPTAPATEYAALFAYIVRGWEGVNQQGAPVASLIDPDGPLGVIWAFEQAQRTAHREGLLELIARYRLPWEALPTQALTDPAVWEALIPHTGVDALVRNLGRMSAIGLLTPGANAVRELEARLTDVDLLRRQRLHPLKILNALAVYRQGHGVKGSLTWTPVEQVISLLDAAFYLAYGVVQPIGRATALCLDVSGSMEGSRPGGMALDAREVSTALALVTKGTDPGAHVLAFTSGGWGDHRSGITPLAITPELRLDQALALTHRLPFGGTDLALPMRYARERQLAIETFIVYTDSQAGSGMRPAHRELEAYRQSMGVDARMIVVAMVDNDLSIADPRDPRQLDISGFSLDTPTVISDFAARRI